MSARQNFIDNLAEGTAIFVTQCNAPILNDSTHETLKRIQAQGRWLVRGIQDLVDHAADIEAKLSKVE